MARPTKGAVVIEPAALARKVAAKIKRYPEKYDQTVWGASENGDDDVAGVMAGLSCGTAACVAGWAIRIAVVAGVELHPREDVEGAARALLGLDDSTAEWMFSGERPREAMPAVLKRLAATGDPLLPFPAIGGLDGLDDYDRFILRCHFTEGDTTRLRVEGKWMSLDEDTIEALVAAAPAFEGAS